MRRCVPYAIPQTIFLFSHLRQRGPTNPIYLFYEEVSINANNVRGNPGDKFYKCYHGQRKTLTITKAMRSSLNGKSIHMHIITSETQYISIGLIGHLKTHFPAMYRLFLVLKDRDEPPTEDEIAIASGKKTLDPTKAAEYLVKLEKASATLLRHKKIHQRMTRTAYQTTHRKTFTLFFQ